MVSSAVRTHTHYIVDMCTRLTNSAKSCFLTFHLSLGFTLTLTLYAICINVLYLLWQNDGLVVGTMFFIVIYSYASHILFHGAKW